jgi:hypothetical protein
MPPPSIEDIEEASHVRSSFASMIPGHLLTAFLRSVQLSFTPENLTALPHLSVSSAINLAKSAGEPASAVGLMWVAARIAAAP